MKIDSILQNEKVDDLYEMANLTVNYHGIDPRVVIWVGIASKQHGLRVKVSNVPNKMDVDDNFVIQMPSLDYDPTTVARWITPKTLNGILEWIKLNQQVLFDYETGKIVDTGKFLNSLTKI